MSSHQVVISAEIRTSLSKGANRQLRNSDKVPAVLYRKGGNANLTILAKSLPQGHTGGQLVSIQVEGATHSALMREVQVDPLTNKPTHIDFQEVDPTAPITARIPVEFVGLTKEQDKECSLRPLMRSVVVRGPAASFPQRLQINISQLKADETLHLSDDLVPAGVTVRTSRKVALAQLIRK